MTRQMKPPPSLAAIVGNERCVYLTNPEKPAAVVRLPKDGKPSREVGKSPMPSQKPRIVWA
jgi:hypothetical protein